MEDLLAFILEDEGTRLPGARRRGLADKAESEGVELTQAALEQLQQLAG